MLGSHQPAGGNGNLLVSLKPAEMLRKQLGLFHRKHIGKQFISHKETVSVAVISERCASEGFATSGPGEIQAVLMG